MPVKHYEEKYCADCRYFKMGCKTSNSTCLLNPIDFKTNHRRYISPSQKKCKKYQRVKGKNHCDGCHTFLEPWYLYCPVCGKEVDPYKVLIWQNG